MARTIVFSGTNDGSITSANNSGSYANARAGTGGTLSLEGNSQVYWSWGQVFLSPNTYQIFNGYTEWTYSPPSGAGNDYAVSGFVDLVALEIAGAVSRHLEGWNRDWGGGALTTADWLNPGSLGATQYFSIINANAWNAGTHAKGGNENLRDLGRTSGPYRMIHVSNRSRSGSAPTGSEYGKVYSSDQSGTAQDPTLTFGTIRRNTLTFMHAASVMLSDGTVAFIEGDGNLPTTGLLRYRTSTGTVSTIATLTTGNTGAGGFETGIPAQQKFALVADASDNLFVIARRDEGGANDNNIVAKCYAKGAGLTWTGKTALADSAPSYTFSGGINQCVGQWHPTSGAGHIMLIGGHIANFGRTGSMFYMVLDAGSLIAGAGTLVVASGADPSFLISATNTDYIDYPNETGSHMDICRDPDVPTRGYVVSTDVDDFINLGTYVLNTNGTISSTGQSDHGATMFAPHDPQGKARVIVIPGQRQIWCNGSHIRARSSNGTILGQAFLDTLAITNFPTQAASNASGAWDMVYDPASSKVWVYYLDTTDSRVLRRTGFSTVSYTGTADSVIVSSAIGAVGSTNVGIRVPRGPGIDERRMSLAVANVNGATLSTVYLGDSLNQAPVAPLLNTITAFDATQAKVFGWTFKDNNPKDTQTAYQLVIIRTSDSVTMLDTGKVVSTAQQHTVPASTLANAVAYQWRVKTWDVADAAGAFSSFQDFTTSGGGNVTITSPATDNPGGQITSDYTIIWSVSGTTQASYRIQAIRTSDGATLSDTGFVTSTATSAVVQNLPTDTESRVQVTVRNAALAVSNPGTRLITPVYSSPEVPLLNLTQGDTYVQADVTNPPPTGDNPEVTVNHLFRRVVGGETWDFIGDMENGGSLRDYTAGAGVAYEYRVTGEA